MKVIKENKVLNGYKLLTESSLNRLLNQHSKNGFAIISASRSERTSSQNDEMFSELKNDIKNLGYSFIPVYGGYVETSNGKDYDVFEDSLFVLPYGNAGKKNPLDFNEFENNITNLGKKYDQETVLLNPPDGQPYYVSIETGEKAIEFNKANTKIKRTYDKDGNKIQYFTALKKKGNQRFSFNENFNLYLKNPPATIMGAHLRSMQGEYIDTTMIRKLHK